MKTLKFKTNIKCGGCIAAVTPFLNQAVGEGQWQVDTSVADKLLTVESEKTGEEITQALKEAGYEGTLLN
jgi:copper chaperone